MRKIGFVVVCLFLFAPFWAEGAESALYMVTADIAAITKTPGQVYEREGGVIPYSENLVSAVVYGNVIEAVPLADGEFAGRWVRTEVTGWEGEVTAGYVDMAALASMPETGFFPEPEPCRFAVDSPPLFLLPGSLPILDYTLPGDEPYYVLAGEVTDGLGTFKDASGQDWTLLRFATRSSYDFGFRHAWTRSENVTRLSRYEPDHTRVDPALVPAGVRNFGRVEDKFRESLLRNGFALDASPVIHERLSLNDLVESYPGSYFEGRPVFTPNFITTDLFLHVFHIVFSKGLKKIEEVNFAPALEDMLKEALVKLDGLEEKSSPNAKPTFNLARDFLTVPMALARAQANSESEAAALKISERAREEIERILKADNFDISGITGKMEDYTFYKPRGHYTASEALSRYFRAMAYLGGTSIPLQALDLELERLRENTALTALLCLIFEDESLRRRWDSLYEPISFLIGAADDPAINDYAPIVKKFLNGSPDKLTDAETLDAMREQFIAAAPAPRIIDAPTGILSQEEREEKTAGFRLLGRRFVLDAWVFARLTSPNVGSDFAPRNLPKAADVMTVLGSDVADAALEGDRRNIPKYAEALEEVKKAARSFLGDWDGTFYSAWLGTLGVYLTDKDSKQFFWNSPLWEKKKLLTASASWAELKHDTVLYAKQSYAEMGAGSEWEVEPFRNPVPLGYVEPSPRTFGAIAAALERLEEIIDKFGLKDDEGGWDNSARIESLLELVRLFGGIAGKAVREEALSQDDYMAISQITSYLNVNLLDAYLENEDDSDQLRMAIVADVATDALTGRALYAATGTPRRLYVFVNDKWGGPRVTIGYTYSSYEFIRPLSEGRMTDEEWRELVYDKARQDELKKLEPDWSRDLFVR